MNETHWPALEYLKSSIDILLLYACVIRIPLQPAGPFINIINVYGGVQIHRSTGNYRAKS